MNIHTQIHITPHQLFINNTTSFFAYDFKMYIWVHVNFKDYFYFESLKKFNSEISISQLNLQFYTYASVYSFRNNSCILENLLNLKEMSIYNYIFLELKQKYNLLHYIQLKQKGKISRRDIFMQNYLLFQAIYIQNVLRINNFPNLIKIEFMLINCIVIRHHFFHTGN